MRLHKVIPHGMWYCYPPITSALMFNLRGMSMFLVAPDLR